jgi:hypothetical protein
MDKEWIKNISSFLKFIKIEMLLMNLLELT